MKAAAAVAAWGVSMVQDTHHEQHCCDSGHAEVRLALRELLPLDHHWFLHHRETGNHAVQVTCIICVQSPKGGGETVRVCVCQYT